jgi:hypothetical protein
MSGGAILIGAGIVDRINGTKTDMLTLGLFFVALAVAVAALSAVTLLIEWARK